MAFLSSSSISVFKVATSRHTSGRCAHSTNGTTVIEVEPQTQFTVTRLREGDESVVALKFIDDADHTYKNNVSEESLSFSVHLSAEILAALPISSIPLESAMKVHRNGCVLTGAVGTGTLSHLVLLLSHGGSTKEMTVTIDWTNRAAKMVDFDEMTKGRVKIVPVQTGARVVYHLHDNSSVHADLGLPELVLPPFAASLLEGTFSSTDVSPLAVWIRVLGLKGWTVRGLTGAVGCTHSVISSVLSALVEADMVTTRDGRYNVTPAARARFGNSPKLDTGLPVAQSRDGQNQRGGGKRGKTGRGKDAGAKDPPPYPGTGAGGSQGSRRARSGLNNSSGGYFY